MADDSFGNRGSAWNQAVNIYNKLRATDTDNRLSHDKSSCKPIDLQEVKNLVTGLKDAWEKLNEKSRKKRRMVNIVHLDHYMEILNSLFGQHQEAAGVVLGAMRMLIATATDSQNQEESRILCTALTEALVDIGRYEEYQERFPNNELVRNSTANLYAAFIEFFVRARVFSERGSLTRSTVPFEKKFKVLQEIRDLRQTIEFAVNAAAIEEQQCENKEQSLFREEIRNYKAKKRKFLEQLEQEKMVQKMKQDLKAIRTWLSPQTFDELRREKVCLEGTCKWILEKEIFQAWGDENSGNSLWIHGIPGGGKSTIACSLIKEIEAQGRPVIFFLCRKDDEKYRRPEAMLKTFLAQILDHDRLRQRQPTIARAIGSLCDSCADPSTVSVDRLCATLETVLSELPKITILIDALDECDAAGSNRSFVLKRLVGVASSHAQCKVVFVSRYEKSIEEVLAKQCLQLEITRADVSDDIKKVVEHLVRQEEKLEHVADIVIPSVIEGADGMFLWARLMVERLSEASSANMVEEMLQQLPRGLEEMYHHILISIGRKLSPRELQLRKRLLSWVTCSMRPLRLQELSVALAVKPNADFIDPKDYFLSLRADIKKLCGPLVEVLEKDKVQIVHATLKEILCKPDDNWSAMDTADRIYLDLVIPEEAHLEVALACLAYIRLEDFDTNKAIVGIVVSDEHAHEMAETHAFLEYATVYWIPHVCETSTATDDLATNIKLLFDSPRCFVWLQYYTVFKGHRRVNFGHHYRLKINLEKWVSGKDNGDAKLTAAIKNYLIQALVNARDTCERILGPDHVGTLKVLQWLGCLYDHEDDIKMAKKEQQKVLDRAGAREDEETKAVVRKSRIEFAYMHRLAGEHEESIKILFEVMGGTDSSTWSCDPLTSEAMADVAVNYRLCGKLEEAAENMELGVKGLATFLGTTSYLTLKYTGELALIYHAQKRFELAQEIIEKNIEVCRKFLGPDDPITLVNEKLLGSIKHDLGDSAKAEKILRETLKSYSKTYPGGRGAASIMVELARVLRAREQTAEAVELLKDSVAIYQRLLGKKHDFTIGAVKELNSCTAEVSGGGILGVVRSFRTSMAEAWLPFPALSHRRSSFILLPIFAFLCTYYYIVFVLAG